MRGKDTSTLTIATCEVSNKFPMIVETYDWFVLAVGVMGDVDWVSSV